MTVFTSTTLGINLNYSFSAYPGTIASGAIITNVTAGYNGDAVYGDNSYAWTVYNYGTIEGTQAGASGIRLTAGGDVHNGSAILTTTRIAGDNYGVAILGASGTVGNYGTIAATGAAGFGVMLAQGGLLNNGAFGASGALITGNDGVRVAGIGTVTNYGTISGLTSGGHGVYLYGGGYVTNQSSGLITGGAGIGAGIGAGTVNNYGTVTGQNGFAVELLDGGAVTNQPGALIAGYSAGIRIDGAAGVVVNAGTISSGTGGGIYIEAGGSVTNESSGRILAYVNGIFINGGSGTVTNLGTIETTLAGGGGVGVFLSSNSLIVNYSSGAIVAASGRAVDFGAAGTLANYGTIANSDGEAVRLQAAGTLVNGAAPGSGALIVGYDGVRIYGPSAALTNYGTIASNGTGFGAQGVDFLSGGTLVNRGTILGTNTYASGINAGSAADLIVNGTLGIDTAMIAGWLNGIDQFSGSGTVINYGTVTSSNGVGVLLEGGGTVTNAGMISGPTAGVRIDNGLGLVVNTGTIAGDGASGFAVNLSQGGTVANGATGTISGPNYGNAVRIDASAGLLINDGTVQGGSVGNNAVYFSAGGTVDNSGLISGANDVVLVRVDGLVTNHGTIAAAGGTSVWLADGGTIANHGLILGTDDVVFTGFTTGTVINYGTIIDTGVYGDGVCLDAGGFVNNTASGIITGPNAGVEIQNGLGSVANAGTITGGGIFLTAGGTVTNAAGALIAGAVQGVAVSSSTGLVLNYGTISGTGSNAGGIYLTAGGGVTNALTGIISGTDDGIEIGSAAGTVLNLGTIAASNVNSAGIWLIAGGSVSNGSVGVTSASIQGNDAVVLGSSAGGIGTVVNYGSIGGSNLGVWLAAGGSVFNYGNISALGTHGDGVATGTYGGLGKVINFATIVGTSLGVFFQAGGSVANYGTITSTGGTGFGIDTEGGAGMVLNNGYISGPAGGVLLEAGGTIVNFGTILNGGTYGQGILISIYGGPGYIRNYNLIAGPTAGVVANNTSVINFGTIAGTGANADGIDLLAAPSNLVNHGSITGTNRAVYLSAGGTVVNDGLIAGAGGVGIVGAAGSVDNQGTIAASSGAAVLFGLNGSVINGASGATSALIGGASSGIIIYGAGSVTNLATVTASVTYTSAIYLVGGGIADNRATGLIRGGGNGVSVGAAAGTVTNLGSIGGIYGAGVRLAGGGSVVNGSTGAAFITGGQYGVVMVNASGTVFNGATGSTGAVIDGGVYGVFTRDAASTVSNYGTITGTSGAGVFLHNGGSIANGAVGLIGGSNDGVRVSYAAGQLDNSGIVRAVDRAVYFTAGGFVINRQGGTIAGGDGIGIVGAAGTISNLGVVGGTAAYSGFAVVLDQGGTVTNGSSAATSALLLGSARGITVYNAAGIVTNFGTIASTITYASAVYLHAGGSLTNQQSGLIRGGGDGLVIAGAAGTVTNLGSIDGASDTGVVLTGGGLIVNGPSGATGATISGGATGVELLNVPATIVNYGTIVDAGYAGVVARAGGSVSNARLIAGYQYGVFVNGASGTVGNAGEISATGPGGTGVNLLAGGAIYNPGTIAGGRNGVFFAAATSIGNRGLISGTSLAGVYAGSGVATVTNYGTIAGGAIGIRLVGGSTLFNAGTIASGGLSVYFIGGNNRLAIDPSAVFIGNVDANPGAGDVLELAPGSGTLTGFGTSFSGFEQIDVDASADWQLAGLTNFGPGFFLTDAGALDFDNDLINDGTLEIEAGAVLSFTGTVGGSGTIDFNGANGILVIGVPSAMTNSIIDFAPTDTIDFVGIGLAASYSYSGSVLRLNNSYGTQLAQVNMTTSMTHPHFTLSSDGGSGTLLGLSPLTGTFSGSYLTGIVLSDPTIQNPALVTYSAFITNNYGSYSGDAVYGTSAAAWTLTNQGTITTNPAATGAAGVRFQAGGLIANRVSAIISGGVNGIVIDGGFGVVSNSGIITAIDATTGVGVALHAGGSVVNNAGGIISGTYDGVRITGGPGTIDNRGTVLGAGAFTDGAALFSGGSVVNGAGGATTALIQGNGRRGVFIYGGLGTVTNYATIASVSSSYVAVYLKSGGTVINQPGGLISASTVDAIAIGHGSGTVINHGTITGIYLEVGGLTTNYGLITRSSDDALLVGGLAGTVANFGTIAFSGAGTAGHAVNLRAGGLVLNHGLLLGAANGYPGHYPGVVRTASQPSTIANFGTIANPNNSNGVNLANGGLLINGAGGYNAALIQAAHHAVYIGGTLGVPTPGAVGTVINYGTIHNSTTLGAAVAMAAGGTAINYGLISSARTGISFTNAGGVPGTIDNFGTIVSTAPLSGTRGSGVYLGAGGVITNRAGATITAERAAVSLAFFGYTGADALVTNYGALSGATGISIGAGDSGDNTIVNFGTISGTNGTAIQLGNGNDEIVIESGSRLNGAVANFQAGDTFDLPFLGFSSAETVSLGAGNLLNISQSGALVYTIELDPSQSFGSNEFGLTNDGLGGTLVVLGPDVTPPVTQTRVLAVNANSGPTAIGIAAPTDPDDAPAVLTINVTGLPTDGAVVLADGVTAVSVGQVLTVGQLTGLQFIPTPNVDGQSSTFSYSVSDPTGNVGFGTAFLGINLPPPPNSPPLINGLGGVEGFGENALAPNDDDSSSAIDITSVFGNGLNFFGNSFTSLYVNNNGNITFNGPLETFTPEEITAGLGNPIIAPFWADVDTEGGPGVPTGGNATGSNTVYYDLDTANHVFTATWDDVGYFSGHNDKFDAFQLRLIDQGGGNFDIEFRYQAIYWTTGDASNGSGGLGGIPARAGFSAGDNINSYELPQSGDQDAMLGIESNAAPAGTQGVTGEIGVYRFQVRGGVVTPPAPTSLALSPGSDSGRLADNRTNDTTPTITGAGGISGDTITLLANGTAIGSSTVSADGTWSVTASPLPDGSYSLTATQTIGSVVSPASAPLSVSIDTSAPVTVPVVRMVQPNTGPAVIGIALPTDLDDSFANSSQAPTIVVSALPSNGIVTIGGVTPVSVGQQLTASELIGLDFTPAAGQEGSTSSFIYSITDPAGNTSTGIASLTISPPPPPPSETAELFDFVFTYADGRDYYRGTVADSGNFGYQVGQIISTVAGHYEIVGSQGAVTGQPSGTVSVSLYSHGEVGQASPTPLLTARGLPDGANGLGSESDSILGLEGQVQPFGPTSAASFPTVPLWAFMFTYADGRAFYSGTVADNSMVGPVANRVVTDAAGNVLGAYSMFVQGSTTRAPGTVIVDRFTRDGVAFTPLRSDPAAVDGVNGLGSEQGSVTINGATFAFSNHVEPSVAITRPTLPATPSLNLTDVFAAETNQLYLDVLGREADPSGLATYSAALGDGVSLDTIRTVLARSDETQAALNDLYHQIFGRDIDPSGASTYTDVLINGSSLASVHLILAQSAEAQNAIQEIYQDILGRDADGGGLTSYMAAIGNPTEPMSLSGVRDVIAHSPEADSRLNQLVVDVLGRQSFAAELAGMENTITADGVSQQTLTTDLLRTGTAGLYTRIVDVVGDTGLTAQVDEPTLFLFSDVTLGNDLIAGFDPHLDTVQLPNTLATNFADIQARTTSSGDGSLISFGSGRSIVLDRTAPSELSAANFRLV